VSITNIVAIAMLSGSPQCPPVRDLSTAVKMLDAAPVVNVAAQQSRENTASNIAANTPITSPEAITAATSPAIGGPQPASTSANEIVVAQTQPVEPPSAAERPTAAVINGATIIVTARQGPPRGDPIAIVNEVSFVAVQAVDGAVVAPIAYGYQKGLPEPLRDGIHNTLNNLDEPVVFLNFLLQFKIGRAVETVGRFAINSTIGAAGLFDVAEKKPFKLPRRSNGLADTLGYYGVGPGPYLFLPLIGSTSLRDVFGRIADLSVLPAAVGKPFTNPLVSASKGVLSSIDDRVENDEILTRIQQSGNPYAAMREYYLKRRQAEIDVLRGKRCNADINLADLEFMDSLPGAKKPSKKSPAPPKN
jgi:phospholipid-binding lipoprotein MlaA